MSSSSPKRKATKTQSSGSSGATSSPNQGLRQQLRRGYLQRCDVLERELRDFASFNRTGYGWCWSSTRVPSKAQGYPQIPYGGFSSSHGYNHRPYMAHQLAWMHANGREPPNPNVTGTNLSHLCGNAQCFRLDHIHEEASGYNNRRKGCQVYIDCIEGGACPWRGIIYVCNHQPRCIRYHPAFRNPDEMEIMFPPSHNHYRAPPINARDNKTDDVNLLRQGVISVLDERRDAISFCKGIPPHSISRREGSIDGNHPQSDEESATSRKRQRVEATCAPEGRTVYVLSDDDGDMPPNIVSSVPILAPIFL